MKPALVFAAGCLLLPVGAIRAHHSFYGTFAQGKTIVVTGVVSEFHFFNPHVGIYFNVTNADGLVTRWMSEGNAASGYRRLGWTAATLKKGDTVRISGDATHDGSPMVTMNRVELLSPGDLRVVRVLTDPPGGQQQAAAQPPAPKAMPLRLADGRPNLTATWTEAERQRFPTPPFNEAGKARQAAARIADDPQIFCEPPGLVRQAAPTPHAIRMTQFKDHVLIEYEEYGGRRDIRFAESRQAAGKSSFGTSIARYDGDALIIESRNLAANWISPHGDQLSDQTTMVETFRRVDDSDHGPTLAIRIVVNDPVYLREPFIINKIRRPADNYQFIPNECRPPLRSRTVGAEAH